MDRKSKDNFVSLDGVPVKAMMHFKSNLNDTGKYQIVLEYSKNWSANSSSFTYIQKITLKIMNRRFSRQKQMTGTQLRK